MNCKNCNAPLEDGVLICPACGEINDTAQPEELCQAPEELCQASEELPVEDTPAPRKTWKIIVAIACCVVLVAGLVAGVLYLLRDTLFRENDVYYKACYTFDAEAARDASGDVVATLGNQQLTNSLLQIYYWSDVFSFLEENYYYLSYIGLDLAKPLSQQSTGAEGPTWEQYFLDSALATWSYHATLALMAEEDGFTLPAQMQATLQLIRGELNTSSEALGFESVDAYVQDSMGTGSSLDAYMEYMELYYLGASYIDYLYTQNLPSAEQVEAYYAEHATQIEQEYSVNKEHGKLVDVRHILIAIEGGTTDESGNVTYSDAEWKACLDQAQSVLKLWASGEATEESFAALANTYSTDPGSNANGGLYTDVYEGMMVPNFNDWCFAEDRKSGDVGIVQSNHGYHVMFFVDSVEAWFRYSEQELVGEICAEMLKQEVAEYTADIRYKKIVLGDVDLLAS